MEVAMVFVLTCYAVATGSKCNLTAPLPRDLSMRNLKKIAGTWYQTVSSNDYISSQYICGTLSGMTVNYEHENFTALITKYYDKAKPRPFLVYGRKARDGYFEGSKIYYRTIAAHDIDQYGRLNVEALKEDYLIVVHPQENSFISDGTGYIAYVNCTPEGWAVWIYTPQKVLATKQLLYIHNELVKHGIHTELRLAKCCDIIPERYDSYSS